MASRHFDRMFMHLKLLPCFMAVTFLIGIAMPPSRIAAQTDPPSTQQQPANVGDAKTAALSYHDSGAYDRDLAIVANDASRWIQERARSATRPALVLDIDETALSNWEVIKLDDFGRPIAGPCAPKSGAPCGWAAWDQLGRDPAIAPTLAAIPACANSQCHPCSSLQGVLNHSGKPRNITSQRLVIRDIKSSIWCRMVRILRQLPISRRRFGPR